MARQVYYTNRYGWIHSQLIIMYVKMPPLDETIEKMEGMEVGSDGTLTPQGQQIQKPKLNG